jgi:hypothetical protein
MGGGKERMFGLIMLFWLVVAVIAYHQSFTVKVRK